MKTTIQNNKSTEEKDFDTVKFFREIKEKISKDIYGMSAAQIKEYLKDKKVRRKK
jgi:hypothetical protein